MNYAKLEKTLDGWRPIALSLLRIMTGLLFLQHGTLKWLGFPAGPNAGSGSLSTMSGVGGVFELIGGALLVIGLFTRPVAFLLCGEMAIAYFYSHNPRGLFPIFNAGELAVLYCFVFLYFICAGAGPWSVDAMMGNKRR